MDEQHGGDTSRGANDAPTAKGGSAGAAVRPLPGANVPAEAVRTPDAEPHLASPPVPEGAPPGVVAAPTTTTMTGAATAPPPGEALGDEAADDRRAALAGQAGAAVDDGPNGDAAAEMSTGDDDFEELSLPSSLRAPTALPEGDLVDPDGRLRIERHLDTRGRINRYRANWRNDAGEVVLAEVREAPADYQDLRREAEVLAEVPYAMLPRLFGAFAWNDRRYLAVEWHEGETLAEALSAGLTLEEAVSIAMQLAQVLRRLEQSGWALPGLQPGNVVLGRPLRLAHLGSAVRIGEEARQALHVAGYTAPEVAHRARATGKEGVYTLGALLYRVLFGVPVPEQGPELAGLSARVRVPGAPQLLGMALAPVEERADIERFYQQLLAFKHRAARRSLSLQIAGGTTIGLNRTRLLNEDACAYTIWSLADHERIAQRALLCVVDGMGGMDAGEVASRAAVRAVVDEASLWQLAGTGNAGLGDAPTAPEPGEQPPSDPVQLVKAAARSVHAAAQGREVGATITCAVVDDGALSLAHVGDTRAYLLRAGTLTQLTQDHSLVAAMVASGVLAAAEARGHPDSNKVLRSLGGQRELPDGYIDTLATTRGSTVLQLAAGDQLLLCSDGVWGVLDDDALQAILLASADCPTAVQAVIEQVLEGGAPDNATLIVARCSSVPTS